MLLVYKQAECTCCWSTNKMGARVVDLSHEVNKCGVSPHVNMVHVLVYNTNVCRRLDFSGHESEVYSICLSVCVCVCVCVWLCVCVPRACVCMRARGACMRARVRARVCVPYFLDWNGSTTVTLDHLRLAEHSPYIEIF